MSTSKLTALTLSLIIINFNYAYSFKEIGPKDTIEEIKRIILSKEKGAYIRFGDGDINLALNNNKAGRQFYSKALSNEMKETFRLKGYNILKTLPYDSSGIWIQKSPLNSNKDFRQAIEYRFKKRAQVAKNLNDKINVKIENVYTPNALIFLALFLDEYLLNFFKTLNNNQCIFIGNEKIKFDIFKALFGDKTPFIKTSSENAFKNIGKTEELVRKKLNTKEYTIIITCMGPSGRILQKRLWNKYDRVFLFDFGSLMDGLHGYKTRKWIQKNKKELDNFTNKLLKIN